MLNSKLTYSPLNMRSPYLTEFIFGVCFSEESEDVAVDSKFLILLLFLSNLTAVPSNLYGTKIFLVEESILFCFLLFRILIVS